MEHYDMTRVTTRSVLAKMLVDAKLEETYEKLNPDLFVQSSFLLLGR